MQSEFIENHWQEILQIDAMMRKAAACCLEHFFGESREIESLLDKDRFAKHKTAVDYFASLAYEYAIKTLEKKMLRRRVYVELLFLLVIKQSTIGDIGVLVVVRSYSIKQTLSLGHEAKLGFGPERIGIGLQVTRLYMGLFGRLPKSYEEHQDFDRQVPSKMPGHLWKKFWAKAPSDNERLRREADEADSIQKEIQAICRDWKFGEMPSLVEEEWLYEESQAK